MIRTPRPSNRGDSAAKAGGPLGGPVGAPPQTPTGFLCQHYKSHAAFRQPLIAIPNRTFDLAHEFGNQATIRRVAKASADCVDRFMSQIQGAAWLHHITTNDTVTVEIDQRYYDQ
jgi:hypothetical protein